MIIYDRSTPHLVRLSVTHFKFSQKDFVCYYCSDQLQIPNNACTANAVVACLLLLQSPTPSVNDDLMYTILRRGAQMWILSLLHTKIRDDAICGISGARLMSDLELISNTGGHQRQKTAQKFAWTTTGAGLKSHDVVPVSEGELAALDRYLAGKNSDSQRLTLYTIQEVVRQRVCHPCYPFVNSLSQDDVDFVSFEAYGTVSVNFPSNHSFSEFLDVPDICACPLFPLDCEYLAGAEVRDSEDAKLEKRLLLACSILEILSECVGVVAAQQLCFLFRTQNVDLVQAKVARYKSKSPALKALLEAHTVWLILLLEAGAANLRTFKKKYYALVHSVLRNKRVALEYGKKQISSCHPAFLQLATDFFYCYLERLYGEKRVDRAQTVLDNYQTLFDGKDPHHDDETVGLPYWRHVPPIYSGLNDDGTTFKTCSPLSCAELLRIGRKKGGAFGCVLTMNQPQVSFALVKRVDGSFCLVDTHPIFADRICSPPTIGAVCIHCPDETTAITVLQEHMNLLACQQPYRAAVYMVEEAKT